MISRRNTLYPMISAYVRRLHLQSQFYLQYYIEFFKQWLFQTANEISQWQYTNKKQHWQYVPNKYIKRINFTNRNGRMIAITVTHKDIVNYIAVSLLVDTLLALKEFKSPQPHIGQPIFWFYYRLFHFHRPYVSAVSVTAICYTESWEFVQRQTKLAENIHRCLHDNVLRSIFYGFFELCVLN